MSPPDMKLLASRVAHLLPVDAQNYVGDFISPRAYQQIGKTPIWAADNDAFSGFNPTRYERMLDKIAAAPNPPMFVTVPDRVGNHAGTMEAWENWQPEVNDRGLRAAFVLQNGVEADWQATKLPWSDMDALFIGGDIPFKFSAIVREIVAAANHAGKWVHMGRVNSIKRMRYASAIGCDSCDGSGMARFPTTVLLPMVRALQRDDHITARQLTLL